VIRVKKVVPIRVRNNNASDKYEWITIASSLYLPAGTSRQIGTTNEKEAVYLQKSYN
jgi:hypothetical protein